MIKRILILGAIALVAGAVVRLSTAPAPAAAVPGPGNSTAAALSAAGERPPPAASAQNAASHPQWKALWTHPTPDLCALSLASDGTAVAWVDNRGGVRRIASLTGKTVWKTPPSPGINHVLALPGSGGVLTYSALNPAQTAVRLLDSTVGDAKTTTFAVDGAVWSVAYWARGRRVVIGTGRDYVYILPMPEASPLVPAAASRRLKLPGIPDSLYVDAVGNDPVALAGTWQDTGVCAWGLDGTPRWQHDEREPDRTYDVHLSADGSTAVAVSTRGPHDAQARLHVWDARTGKLLWSEDLNGLGARALVSANGAHIAVTYARSSSGGGGVPGALSEHKVVLFDRAGRRLFGEKGGLFFTPSLVALSADGQRVTVRDNGGYLWTLDEHGRILSRIRLPLDPSTGAPPTIRDTVATEDGTYIVVRRGDGQITLFQAVAS